MSIAWNENDSARITILSFNISLLSLNGLARKKFMVIIRVC